MHATPAGRAAWTDRIRSLRSSAFAGLWLGQTVSSLGSQVSLVAIPLVAVFALGAGPAQVAILAALETAPYVIVALPAGLLADRVDRRRLMIASDIGRAIAMGVLVAALAMGLASLALLTVVAAVVGGLGAVFTVAQQAYLPEVLPTEQLVRGNQRLEISDAGARIAGPGIAGIVVQGAGAMFAVGLDSVSYVLSAVAIGYPRRPPRADAAMHDGPDPGWRAISDGVRHVWRDPVLRSLVTATAVFNLATGMMLAQLVLFATHDLAITAAAYGLMLALGNVGFLVGALTVGRLERRLGSGRVLVVAALLGAIALVAVASSGALLGFPLLVFGRFLGALSSPLYNVMLVTVRQARSPLALQARVAAAFRAIDWGTAPVGALLSGIVGAAIGVPAVMWLAAVVGVASVPYVLAWPVRSVLVTPVESPSGRSLPAPTAPPDVAREAA